MAILTLSGVFAQADVTGSNDHPLISRFPGSSRMVYDTKEFNEYVVPLGNMVKGRLAKSQNLEGKEKSGRSQGVRLVY